MAGPPRALAVPDDRPLNLTQLLKRLGAAESGGQAKSMIADGLVKVNGEVETRKRKQLSAGDTIELPDGSRIRLESAPPVDPPEAESESHP